MLITQRCERNEWRRVIMAPDTLEALRPWLLERRASFRVIDEYGTVVLARGVKARRLYPAVALRRPYHGRKQHALTAGGGLVCGVRMRAWIAGNPPTCKLCLRRLAKVGAT